MRFFTILFSLFLTFSAAQAHDGPHAPTLDQVRTRLVEVSRQISAGDVAALAALEKLSTELGAGTTEELSQLRRQVNAAALALKAGQGVEALSRIDTILQALPVPPATGGKHDPAYAQGYNAGYGQGYRDGQWGHYDNHHHSGSHEYEHGFHDGYDAGYNASHHHHGW